MFDSIVASGNSGQVVFTITGGALPDGLTLIPQSQTTGTVFGVPTAAGSFTFTVRAVDAILATVSHDYVLLVTPADTTTVLTAAPSTGLSLYGDNVTFAGTVTTAPATCGCAVEDGGTLDAGGPLDADGVMFGPIQFATDPPRLPVTVGTVQFKDEGLAIGAAQTVNGSGVASFATTALLPGVHHITAMYVGSASYHASTSAVFVQTVRQIITFAPLTNQPYGSVSSLLTATANSGLAVTYVSSTPDACTTTGTNAATLTILEIGTCTIVASQIGNGSYLPASSVTRTFTVTSAPLTIKADDVGRVYGGPSPVFTVTYTGLVNGETSAVLGGALVLLSTASDTSSPGAYSVTPSGLTSTRYTITFTPGTLTVSKASTGVVLTPSTTTLAVGQTVVLTAQLSVVAPGTGTPTGTVTFVDGTTILGSASPSSAGLATLTTPLALDGRTHTLTAAFAGDANFALSASNPVAVTVALFVPPAPTPTPGSSGGGGGGSHVSRPAPTAVLAQGDPGGAVAGAPAGPVFVAPAAPPPPAPVAPPVRVVLPTPLPQPVAPAPPTAPAPAPAPPASIAPDAPAPLSVTTFDGVTIALGQLGIHPAAPADFEASVPDSLRIEVQGAPAPLVDNLGTAPQVGALGGGNAVRLAPPVDLNLIARDVASNNEVTLPDGALEQTYLVSLPVLAQPTNPNDAFTWLVEVKENGQFLGYMRYPSTFDPTTNTLVYELPAHLLIDSSVLPVILIASQVQAFLPDVHGWSSPFATGGDFGVIGPTWTTYAVLAPQVGGRIGVREPTTGEMIWIDASGVGPTEGAASPPPDAADNLR